jgi:hypothetical protein
MRAHEGSDTTIRARTIRTQYDVIHHRAVTGTLFARWMQGANSYTEALDALSIGC